MKEINFGLINFIQIVLGLVFSLLIYQEIDESIKWGMINALDLDVLVLSILSLIGILINHRFSNLISSMVLVYFIWLIITRHFPAYAEYNCFTTLFVFVDFKSQILHNFFHVILYSGLVSYLFYYNFKKPSQIQQ
jgi:hypothetical protein